MLLPRFIIKEMMHFEMGCLMNLSDTVTVVKGVGMRMKEKLERLGIKTVEDLISYYPRRYEDWTRITPMADLSYEWKLRFMERWLKFGKHIPEEICPYLQ